MLDTADVEEDLILTSSPIGHTRKLKPRRGGILVEKEFLRLSKVP
jgi:hypothetical protein